MVKLVNRAKMSTATTGTGTITLGSAVDGFQTFAAAGVSNGDTVRYAIEDGFAWEIGTGTYNAADTTLTRTVIESSNSDAPINLSGNALVFLTVAGADLQHAAEMNQGVATTDSPSFAGLIVDTDALVVDPTNDRVGINKTSPATTLDVGGSLYVSSIIRNTGGGSAAIPSIQPGNDADTGMFWPGTNAIGFSTTGSERLRITSTGNVGIGTTGPTVPLSVVGDISGTRNLSLGTAGVDATSYISQYRSTVETIWGPLTSRSLFGTVSNHDQAFQTNNTERMRITAAGNVGIGTSTPIAKLDVDEVAPIFGQGRDTNTSKFWRPRVPTYAGTNTGTDWFSPIFAASLNAENILYLGGGTSTAYAATEIQFRTAENATTTAGTTRMFVSGDGKVGIGSNNPTGLLTIGSSVPRVDFLESDGSAGFNNTILIRETDVFAIQTRNGGAFVSNDYRMTANASGALTHEWRTANTERMRIDSSGNVLIGTTTGNYRLAIKDTGVDIALINQNDKVWTIGQNVVVDEFSIRDASAGQTRLHIDASGSVGIGTSSPSEALTVVGNGVFGDATDKYNTVTINGGHVFDGGNDYGLTINAFEPAITMLDRSTGAGSSQMFGLNNGGILFRGDTTNDGTIGHDTNTTDFDLARFEPDVIRLFTGGSESVRIDSSGDVGIGTTNPITPIHVVRASNEFMRLQNTAAGVGSGYISFYETGGTRVAWIGNSSAANTILAITNQTNAPMTFRTNDTERMRIDSSGSLLIGTSSFGGSKLSVVGLPTSSAGLSAGAIWNDGGTLKIV